MTCGETEIRSMDIRYTIANLRKNNNEVSVSGFQQQFQVILHLYILYSYIISKVNVSM